MAILSLVLKGENLTNTKDRRKRASTPLCAAYVVGGVIVMHGLHAVHTHDTQIRKW